MLLLEHHVHSVKEHMAEYEIENITIYNIFDQIWKDTDLDLYVKQHKSNRNGRGAFYANHSIWLGPNQLNATASEA